MPRYDRTGHRVLAMKLGRWNCLRQEWMTAGEVITPNISGWVRLAQLREPLTTDVKFTLAAFYTPMRFLWDGWLGYVKQGVDGTTTIPTTTVPGSDYWDSLGLGHVVGGDRICKHWMDNWRKIWWWYMRFPDDTDAVLDSYAYSGASVAARNFGFKAVALESLATRLRKEPTLTEADYMMQTKASGSREKFDLRAFGQLQARLGSEITRDWYSRERYQELMNQIWHTNVGDNPEERPFLVGHEEGWMSGSDLIATDGDNLGALSGAMKVDIDHNFGPVLAPEHGILSYWLTMRIPPIYSDQANYLTAAEDFGYKDWTGEPSIMASAPPEAIKARRYAQKRESATVKGYAPAGQHLRTGWSSIDGTIAARGTTMVAKHSSEGWYHPDMDHAFVSLAYGHAYGTLRFMQPSRSLIPDIKSSIYAGTR